MEKGIKECRSNLTIQCVLGNRYNQIVSTCHNGIEHKTGLDYYNIDAGQKQN